MSISSSAAAAPAEAEVEEVYWRKLSSRKGFYMIGIS